MSTALIELNDRTILDTGEVVLGYEALLRMARDGIDFHPHSAIRDKMVDKYNRVSAKPIKLWTPGEMERPAPSSYEWDTPEPFKSVDVFEVCAESLIALGLSESEKYVDRLTTELNEMSDRGMLDLIRHLMYMVVDFRERGVVWGVGRGSSCSSLVLYLIGLNRVDPVKYDIPLSEFLR